MAITAKVRPYTDSTQGIVDDLSAGWIGGSRRLNETGVVIPLVDPDTDHSLGAVPECDAAGVDAAVRAARQSFEAGIWSRRTASQRRDVLLKAAALIRSNAEELARGDTATTGLLLHRSTLKHVAAAAGWFEYFAHAIVADEDIVLRSLAPACAVVSREPIGVAALFAPWNIPLMGASLKLASALACGNSCVLKPSEQSPLGSWRLMALLQEAGIPDGVVNLVNGRGEITGHRARHRRVRNATPEAAQGRSPRHRERHPHQGCLRVSLPRCSGLQDHRRSPQARSNIADAAVPLNARTQSINPASLSTIRAATAAADMLALIKPPVSSSANPDQIRHRHEYDGLVSASRNSPSQG